MDVFVPLDLPDSLVDEPDSEAEDPDSEADDPDVVAADPVVAAAESVVVDEEPVSVAWVAVAVDAAASDTENCQYTIHSTRLSMKYETYQLALRHIRHPPRSLHLAAIAMPPTG